MNGPVMGDPVPAAAGARAGHPAAVEPRLLSPFGFVARRLRGEYAVDPWGLDADLVAAVAPFGRARWSVEGDGLDHLPAGGGALLVHNQGWGWAEQAAVSAAVHRASGRVVRFVGVPDLPVVQPVLRGLGGVLGDPAELRGVLRAGHLASVGAGRERFSRRFAGAVAPEALQPAVDVGVPVVPVAVRPTQWGLRWLVTFAEPVEPSEHHDALAVAELAEQVRAGLQAALDHPWG